MTDTTPLNHDPDASGASDSIDPGEPLLPSHLPPRLPPEPPSEFDVPTPPSVAEEGVDAPTPPPIPEEIPPFADGVMRPLHPASLTADTIASWIFTAVLTVPTGIGLVILELTRSVNVWVWVGWVGALIFFSLLAIISPRLTFKHTRYAVSPRGMHIKRGWLWRRTLTVPRSRVQHTDVTQGPMMRKYGFAKLTVYTAGSVNNSVELTGLAHDRAEQIRDYLVHHRAESDGV